MGDAALHCFGMKFSINSLRTGVLATATLIAACGLIAHAWFEVSSGILHGDAQIFQTVGRGILNGLTPYKDLFETKPPGVFLLHALSLWMFDSQLLVKMVQAGVLLALPFLIFVPSVDLIANRPAEERRVLSLLSLLFGLLLGLYIANQAGHGLTESYGACAAIAFLVLLLYGKVNGARQLVILAVLMLLAVGFKEPFILTILGGVILMRRDILPSFVYPLGVAAALGLFALFILGYAGPFFQIYLPHMLGFHVHQHDGSTLVRALEIPRTFMNMGAYSWWFSVAVTTVWIAVPATAIAERNRGFFLRWIIASYLFFLAIAVGGDFYGHHFIFAVPVYAALWWTLLRTKLHRFVLMMLIVAMTIGAFVDTRLLFGEKTRAWKEKETVMRTVAAVIDRTVEDCDWEKYLQLIPREGGPYAFTKASPYGPIFIHYSRFIGANAWYQSEHIHALQEAPLILIRDIDNSNLSDAAKEYLSERYSETPPACVGANFAQPEPYRLLFRRTNGI